MSDIEELGRYARFLADRQAAPDAEHPAIAADGTERLCRALYGREPQPRDYVGGSNAPMMHDAADRVARLTPTPEEREDAELLAARSDIRLRHPDACAYLDRISEEP